jgi:hypothetical protein
MRLDLGDSTWPEDLIEILSANATA